jgi:hypothetical protein
MMPQEQRSKYVSIKRKLLAPYHEQIKQMYESGKSSVDISKEIGFSDGAIQEHLILIGVKMRKRTDYGFTEETRKKLSAASIGENNHEWKGDQAKIKTGRERARKIFPCPKGKQRHHIDGNTLNNSPDNILIVTPKEHIALDNRKFKSEKRRNKLGQYGPIKTPCILKRRVGLSQCRYWKGKEGRNVWHNCASCSKVILLNDNQQTEKVKTK